MLTCWKLGRLEVPDDAGCAGESVTVEIRRECLGHN